MIPSNRIGEVLERLNFVANDLANQIYTIRTGMTGKGISPDKSPLIEYRLQEIENKLRKLGGNFDNPVPF